MNAASWRCTASSGPFTRLATGIPSACAHCSPLAPNRRVYHPGILGRLLRYAVPTGTIGPTERDPNDGRMRNILSAKHAAQAAGLGVIGRNTLLITPEYGNMVWLGAVICELPLTPDPLLENAYCAHCSLCVDACPAHAVGEPAMEQDACKRHAFGGENGGEWKILCHQCRDVCPHCLGVINRGMRRPLVKNPAR